MSSEARAILLSIAIPTKNRQHYLINLIDELLRSERQDFEIIIQDNSDDDQLAAYVAAKNDVRLHYAYRGEWISVVDNCDAAVRACSGHFVCMLGDDDGIMLDESLAVLAEAKAAGDDAIICDLLLYTWPDISHRLFTNFGGRLFLRRHSAYTNRRTVLERARSVVSRYGAMGLEGLPCVYQGFVSRAVLRAVEYQTGSHFPGPSPDMANAIGIATLLKRSRAVPSVLIISGHSRKSGAGQGTMKEHRGSIANQRHLPADTVATWYPEIPFYWSGPTIYAQSLRRAVERMGTMELGKPRYACLYAACLIFEPSYAAETWRAMRQSGQSLWVLAPQIAYYGISIMIKRAVQYKNNLAVRLFPARASIAAESIADAILAVRAFPR
jgi:Glycosyl transferase family 2